MKHGRHIFWCMLHRFCAISEAFRHDKNSPKREQATLETLSHCILRLRDRFESYPGGLLGHGACWEMVGNSWNFMFISTSDECQLLFV